MLAWYGRLIFRARWLVLILGVVASALAAWYGLGVFGHLTNDISGDAASQSVKVNTIVSDQFPASAVDLIIYFQNDTRTVTDPAYRAAVTTTLGRIGNNDHIAAVTSYYTTGSSSFVSTDQHATFATVRIKHDGTPGKTIYEQVLADANSPDFTVKVGGVLAADNQINDQISEDLARTESITFPIIAVALIIVFGGLVAASLPLIVGGVAIVGALALLRMLTTVTTVSVYASNIVTILGLGLAIDYALFIVTRFREELAKDEQDVQGALERTLATAGRTVLFSGLTVATSLVSLTIFPLLFLQSLGAGTIASVVVAMLAAVTVLPAVLGIMGRRVNALSIQRLFRRGGQQPARDESGAWYRLSQGVMRFPIPVLIAVVAILVTLGIPFLSVRFGAPDIKSLPTTISSRYVFDQLTSRFPQQGGSSHTIIVTGQGNILSLDNLRQLQAYTTTIQNLPNVTHVDSIVTVDPRLTVEQYAQIYAQPTLNPQLAQLAAIEANGSVTQMTVTVNADQTSQAAADAVKAMRSAPVPPGFTTLVGGQTAARIDLVDAIWSRLPLALGIIALATLLLLFLMTGSIVVPIKAIVLNILSLSATFGALVFIFQEGHGSTLLNFEPIGALDPSQLVLLFAIAFGLSMDYEVFLLSRIKEEYDLSNVNEQAVARGLQRTGWLITSAAALLAIVMLATGTSHIVFIQSIGLGLGIAVVMDATLVRALLVPATMRLLGRINWWPNRQIIRETH